MPNIRPMTESDWEQFHLMDIEIFPDDPFEEESFRRRLDHDGFFALELNEQVIGNLILARFGEGEAHLGRIGLAKSHQGKGFGTMLMKYALEWFRKEGGIKEIHLYTQNFNETAQGLYKKFGFERTGTTWHYFVSYDSVAPKSLYTCHDILEEEIDPVGRLFPSIPGEQIRRFLSSDRNHVLVLKDRSSDIQGVCRFTPSFPGCFPFEITHIECFDDFVKGIKNFSLPEYDYCRVTFTDNPELADLCESRQYRLHHRLHKMSCQLQ